MKSQMFSFNRGIIKQNLKQHGWVGIVYFVGLLFTLPLHVLMLASSVKEQSESAAFYQNHTQSFFDLNLEIQALLLFILPVLAGVTLFRYLQTKESVDMTHSLPIRRENLYINHLLSGLILLLPPVWITGIVTWFVTRSFPFFEQITFSDLSYWMGVMTMFTIFVFVVSILVGMITGLSIAQGILTYIFLFLPVGLLILVSYHLELILYGFSANYYGEANSTKWSPITRFLELTNENTFTRIETFVYLILITLFLIFGYLLYKQRHLETATQVITFPLLKPIFKYGVSFSFMLFAGAYFSAAQNHDIGWVIFGYLLGAFVGFIVAEMFLAKTWRIFSWKLIPSFLGFAVLMGVIFVGLQTDVTGYESKVPETKEIKSVYFGNGYYDMKQKLSQDQDPFSTDSEYIQVVRNLHEFIVQKQPKEVGGSYSRSIFIAYQLTNGKEIVREYQVPVEAIESVLKPVMETNFYKTQSYALNILDIPVKEIRFIQPSVSNPELLVITDSAEIQELTQILKEEILNMTYEEMTDTRIPWAMIDLNLGDTATREDYMSKEQALGFQWKKSYYQLEQWLLKKGYLEKARILPENIKYLEVAKIEKNESEQHLPPEEIFRLSENKVKVTDQSLISQALEQVSDHSTETFIYYVRFTTEKDEHIYGIFTNEHTPAFVPGLFKYKYRN